MTLIESIVADITTLHIDAIVNAAKPSLEGGGGVDGAIHRAAGPELAEAAVKLAPCPTGEARVTPGFNLPARWVIHTVGPVWNGGGDGEPEQLANAYRNSLALASENGIRSIAFPGISTGVYRFPVELANQVAVATIRAFVAENSTAFDRIALVWLSEAEAELARAHILLPE